MRIVAQRRAGGGIATWVSSAWIVAGVEILWLLALGAHRLPPDALPGRHQALREGVLGVAGATPGLVRPFVLLNLLMVIGLWCAARKRPSDRRGSVTLATALGAALLFAALSKCALVLCGTYPRLVVGSVLRATEAGYLEMPVSNPR